VFARSRRRRAGGDSSKRARIGVVALAAGGFLLLVTAVVCSSLPRVPTGLEIVQPRASGRFIIYGDTRKGMPFESLLRKTDYDRERRLVAARIAEEKPDFVLHTGDLVGRGSSGTQWHEEWDEAVRPLSDARVPIYMAWGNHEYWADPGRTQEGAINHHFGGRGVYFQDPSGHLLEIITRPYGSTP